MKFLWVFLLALPTLSAQAIDRESQVQPDTFSHAVFNKSAAPSPILNKLKGDQNKSNQCVIDCLNAYSACLAVAQGPAQVRACEWDFEICMVGCGI